MKEITTTEVRQQLQESVKLHLIDVRETEEVAEGMIPTAVHIPLGELPDNLHQFDRGKSYIIVCRSGARSGRATEYLTAEGFDASNMVGGMLEWNEGNE